MSTQLSPQNISQRVEQAENYMMRAGEILNQILIDLQPQKTNQSTVQPPTQPPAMTTPTPKPTTTTPSVASQKSPSELANENTVKRTQQQQATQAQTRSLDDIRISFPEELESRLDFSLRKQGTVVWIKPKQFLGSENFAKINTAVRGMGGEYVSAGKDSGFEVPLKKQGA